MATTDGAIVSAAGNQTALKLTRSRNSRPTEMPQAIKNLGARQKITQ